VVEVGETRKTRTARVIVPCAALLAAILFLAVTSPALAAPAVDGWQMTSLSDQANGSPHARLDDGRLVWVEGSNDTETEIVLCEITTGERQVIVTGGTKPEISGDHIVYLGEAGLSSSGRMGQNVFVHTISSGDTKQLTANAQTRFNYQLTIHGDKVLWLSATQVGIEGPDAGDISLFMHDLSKDEKVALAAGEPGEGGPKLYVASSEWVVWNHERPYQERPLQVWTYSPSTGQTRELTSLAGYQVLALAGDTLLLSPASGAWDILTSAEELFSYNLRSGELRRIDEESIRFESVQADGDFVAWAGYGNGSVYVALYDVRTGALTRIPTPGYDAGGLVLRGDLLVWHGQYRGRYAGTTWNYLFVYDHSRGTMTRLATLFGSNDDYDTDGEHIAFTTGNWWPYDWEKPLELLLASPVDSGEEAFLDVSGAHPYRTAIQGLKEREIVGGYASAGGAEFRPDASLTRGQFAKMLALALEIPVDATAVAPFADIEPGLFPGAYVAALAARGIAQGTGAGTFSPYASLTRAQLMTFLVRALDTVKPGLLGTPPTSTWPDYQGALGPFDPTHGPYLLRGEVNGLVDGLLGYGSRWDPWRPATRAEAAQALWNFLAKDGIPAPAPRTDEGEDS
jgi:Tol biopolymer transport system component